MTPAKLAEIWRDAANDCDEYADRMPDMKQVFLARADALRSCADSLERVQLEVSHE